MAGISTSQLAIIAVILVLTAIMLANTRRRLKNRGPSPSEYAREQIARLKEHSQVKGDMEQLLIELHEAARRLNAQLDTKAAKLETLIREADQRIARLQSRSGSDGDVSFSDVGAAAPDHLDVTVDNTSGPQEDGEPVDPLRHKILTLAKAGKTPVEIARDTGTQPGEVELILALQASGKSDRPPLA
jgi:hypothetical protein